MNKKMKGLYRPAILMLILVLMSGMLFMLTGCNDNDIDERKRIIMEIIHPETDEIIEDLETVQFSYDGKSKIPLVKLRIDGTNDYLIDNFIMSDDYQGNNLLDYVVLYLKTEDDKAHIRSPWSEWPSEVGRYSIGIYFNYYNNPYKEYYEARVQFWLVVK